jgi:hypothetical protein
MCTSTSDLKYLISNESKFSEGKVSSYVLKNEKKLKELIESMQEEYKGLVFNKKELIKQKELGDMMFIEVKHNLIIKCLSLFIETEDFSVLEILEEIQIKFDKEKELLPQLEKVRAIAYGLKNRINIKTINFKKKYNLTDTELEVEHEDTSSDIEKQLDSQALLLEGNLEKGYRIDIKKTSVLRWVNLREQNDEKIAQSNR